MTAIQPTPEKWKNSLPGADLCLLQMPYSTLHNPSIGLGLLKAYAADRGLRTRVLYPNLDWASDIGLDVFLPIQRSRVEDQLGEWTFAGVAIPEYRPDRQQFYRLAAGSLKHSSFALLSAVHGGVDIEGLMDRVRQRAADFIDRVALDVLSSGAKLVGCSSVFQQQMASLAVLRRIKELSPDVVTLLGGANCEAEMGLTVHRNFDWVDVVVSGEADGFFGDLCEVLLEKGTEVEAADLPYGVLAPCHRGQAEQAYPEAQRAVLENMDQAAVPDYSDYFEALEGFELSKAVVPGVLVETSRGCWWGQKSHCTFCGLNGAGMAFRAKSPERALADFAEVVERHGVRRLECVDNILDMRYFKSVLPDLARLEEPYQMFYEVKPNLRRDQLEELAAAGIRWLQPGIESLDDRVLKLLAKGGTGLRNIQLLKWSRELGVRLAWGLLHGVPGEEDTWYEDMAEWLPWLSHLQPPSGFVRIRYDRFSPYHMHPERFGVNLSPLRIYREIYPFDDAELEKLVYFFEDYDDLSRGDVDPTLAGHPRSGLKAVALAVHRWSQEAEPAEGEPARLEIHSDDGDTLSLVDTRSVATEGRHQLRSEARAVYLACEKAPNAEGIVRAVAAETGAELSWQEISPIVDDLISWRLVLPRFGRYLSLAIAPPSADYCPDIEAPEGYTAFLEGIRYYEDRSLCQEARKLPQQRGVAELFC